MMSLLELLSLMHSAANQLFSNRGQGSVLVHKHVYIYCESTVTVLFVWGPFYVSLLFPPIFCEYQSIVYSCGNWFDNLSHSTR